MKEYILSEKEEQARDLVCHPLDGLTLDEARERVSTLSDLVGTFKVNDLFTSDGDEALELVDDNNAEAFLDLKFHDIPNTVYNHGYKTTDKVGVYMFNVHASGGLDMMKKALEGAESTAKELGIERPKIYAVTVLTSLDLVRFLHVNQPLFGEAMEDIDFEEYYPVAGIEKRMKKGEEVTEHEWELVNKWDNLMDNYTVRNIISRQVLHLAKLAEKAGLDGIVCSATELKYVKPHMQPDFLYATPGIEQPLTGEAGDDQMRTLTPSKAVEMGATKLVIGRAIAGSKEDALSPDQIRERAYAVLQDIAKVL